ncbi:TSUP family transporter [Candidatus Bathyarchaeota archaeon]|nr:TSUP family transporter [Candidatus Bathyarchaeota archaeon]
MDPFTRDIIVIVVSFTLGLIDLSVGMGFGFTVTPVLILLGYSVTETLPAVLAASFVGGVISSISHQRLGNVDFDLKSRALKMAIIMGGIGALGMSVGVYFSFNIPEEYTQTYIGLITLLSGIFIQYKTRLTFKFTWLRISIMGLIGAINKGLTGGGYGPVITSGGILSGTDEKAAVAIQSLSESFVSMVGVFYYFFSGDCICWSLTRNTVFGVILAAPVAATILKKIDQDDIKIVITITSFVMGLAIIMKTWDLFIFSG